MKIFKGKRGQGLSLNVIVLAALALLVLVVLGAVFIGRTGTFSKQAKDCVGQGGECKEKEDCKDHPILPGTDCTGEEVCCLTKILK